MSVSIRVNLGPFNAALREYVRLSKKSVPEIINTKGFFIARNATRNTIAATRGGIRSDLDRIVSASYTMPNGNAVSRDIPLAWVLVQKRAVKEFGRGLPPRPASNIAAMQQLEKQIEGERLRAIGYMRSGWLHGVEAFGQAIGKALRGSRRKGNGGARISLPSQWTALFWNSSAAKNGGPKLLAIAGAALRDAITMETASIKRYVDRKLQSHANRVMRRATR